MRRHAYRSLTRRKISRHDCACAHTAAGLERDLPENQGTRIDGDAVLERGAAISRPADRDLLIDAAVRPDPLSGDDGREPVLDKEAWTDVGRVQMQGPLTRIEDAQDPRERVSHATVRSQPVVVKRPELGQSEVPEQPMPILAPSMSIPTLNVPVDERAVRRQPVGHQQGHAAQTSHGPQLTGMVEIRDPFKEME